MRHDVEPPLSCAARQRCRPCRARIRRDQDGKGTPAAGRRAPRATSHGSPSRLPGVHPTSLVSRYKEDFPCPTPAWQWEQRSLGNVLTLRRLCGWEPATLRLGPRTPSHALVYPQAVLLVSQRGCDSTKTIVQERLSPSFVIN